MLIPASIVGSHPPDFTDFFMDLVTALLTAVATLAACIAILWPTLRGVERRFGRKLADSEAGCQERLEEEIVRREADRAKVDQLQADVRAILVGEVNKNISAMVIVGERLAQVIEQGDAIADSLNLPPRIKDPNRATTVQIAAIKGR
jgi:hypothetical protein